MQHYRHWIIWRCPTIRFLDYQKVKDVERKQATELFGTSTEPSALASKVLSLALPYYLIEPLLSREQIMGIKSRTFDVPSGGMSSMANGVGSMNKVNRLKLTEREKKRTELLIKNAKSLQEITRLEKELNEGRIPGGGGGDEMEE